MTVRPAHTRPAHTVSARSTLRRQLRLTLLVAGITVGASACELSLGSEPTPAAVPADRCDDRRDARCRDPLDARRRRAANFVSAGSGLPSDVNRGGALPPVGSAGSAVDPATVPPAPASVPTTVRDRPDRDPPTDDPPGHDGGTAADDGTDDDGTDDDDHGTADDRAADDGADDDTADDAAPADAAALHGPRCRSRPTASTSAR